jgi:hypothetical protein
VGRDGGNAVGVVARQRFPAAGDAPEHAGTPRLLPPVRVLLAHLLTP